MSPTTSDFPAPDRTPVLKRPAGSAPDAGTAEAALRAVDYEDFRLVIDGTGGDYSASVVESPAGESTPGTIHWLPRAAQLRKESDLRGAGTALFDTFISGEIRELYRESLALTKERRKGLRIKLLIDPVELSAQPWELLYDTRNHSHLGLSSRTPIVRHRRIAQALEPLRVELPLRILGLIANPLEPGLPTLNVDNERRLIETALAELRQAGLVELKWLDGGTWEDLQGALWRDWHVFHFIGHGDYDPAAGEGYLLLETREARAHRLRAKDLGLLLRGQGAVRLAVLNSCKGAAGDTVASSTSTADALVVAGMGGVVAMQNPISDKAAVTFSRILYLGLANRLPLDAATTSARVAMKIEHADPVEWWTPVLHMRAADGVLFDLPSPAADSRGGLSGMEYLAPDLDDRLQRTLARRRRHRRAIYSWLLAPIPLLGFLISTSASSFPVQATIQASGITVALASPRQLFSDLPRLQSFRAWSFDNLMLPDASFPARPGPDHVAQVGAVAADSESWISLQPWTLPGGSRIRLDHPPGARRGEYFLSLDTDAGRSFYVTLVHRLKLSRFEAGPESRDFGTGSPMRLATSDTTLRVELQFLRPDRVNLPDLDIKSLELNRRGFDDAGPVLESTVQHAEVRVDGSGSVTVGEGTHLVLEMRDGALTDLMFQDRGISLEFRGQVRGIRIGQSAIPPPSKLEWLVRAQPAYLWLGVVTYLLILVVGVLQWRGSHVPALAK